MRVLFDERGKAAPADPVPWKPTWADWLALAVTQVEAIRREGYSWETALRQAARRDENRMRRMRRRLGLER